jgi:uncharacterized protein YwqG
MDTEQIIDQLGPWLAKHQRAAWKPVVQDGDGEPTASKFSGTPWIAQGDAWPLCKRCQHPMQLFVQLDLAQLPEPLQGAFGAGLLQLFYCTDETCGYSGGWEPFSDVSSLVRVVQPVGPALETAIPQEPGYFPAKRIVAWNEIPDYPDPPEHDELGLEYTYDRDAGTTTLTCQELGLTFEGVEDDYLAENIATSALGDKLAGWPNWIQGVEYPHCPTCGTRMALVFQVDSEDNLPFMFGDVGTGHVTQCPDHQHVVAFGWACC